MDADQDRSLRSASICVQSAADLRVDYSSIERRLFEQALEGAEELGGHGAVHGAVVGGQGDGHHGADDERVPLDDRPLLGRADGEDADLGQVQDGVELADAVHPEVA